MRHILAALALIGLAGPAFACINDTELPKYEREFRSAYRKSASPAETPSQSAPTTHYMMMGGGAALLAGAVAMVVTRGRNRS